MIFVKLTNDYYQILYDILGNKTKIFHPILGTFFQKELRK